MSRKYNGRLAGKKARGISGSCGLRKHRASGHKGIARRSDREAVAKFLAPKSKPKLQAMFETVHAAVAARTKGTS